MSKDTILSLPPHRLGNVALRGATESDLDNLRRWKNEQREFFFHKEEISPSQQAKWFEAFRARPDDFMFVVLVDQRPVGCMGIRYMDGAWDVYNVILGDQAMKGSGVMSLAFGAMLQFAKSRVAGPVGLKVLKKNPAVGWYARNGLAITGEHSDYYEMTQ